MKFILALTLLMLADAVSTVFLVKFGPCSEVNPAAAWALSIGAIFFISAKAMIGLLAGVGLQSCERYLQDHIRAARELRTFLSFTPRRILVVIYAILMVWHAICWLAV